MENKEVQGNFFATKRELLAVSPGLTEYGKIDFCATFVTDKLFTVTYQDNVFLGIN
jgi:hypothetical protein